MTHMGAKQTKEGCNLCGNLCDLLSVRAHGYSPALTGLPVLEGIDVGIIRGTMEIPLLYPDEGQKIFATTCDI